MIAKIVPLILCIQIPLLLASYDHGTRVTINEPTQYMKSSPCLFICPQFFPNVLFFFSVPGSSPGYHMTCIGHAFLVASVRQLSEAIRWLRGYLKGRETAEWFCWLLGHWNGASGSGALSQVGPEEVLLSSSQEPRTMQGSLRCCGLFLTFLK